MKKQVCKDCYYAGFDKCDHVKKLTKKQEVMEVVIWLLLIWLLVFKIDYYN
jgi:hypothetical protein